LPIIVNTSPLLDTEQGEAAEILRRTGYAVRTSLYGPPRGPADLIELFKDAAAAIVALDRLDAEVLAHAPHLRVIARTGVGYDTIDVAAATAHNIVVCATVGSNDRTVAEHTWGLILALARRIPQQDAQVRSGGWQRLFGMELWSKTLGVVGFGAIGRAVARRGVGFEMRVLAHDIRPDGQAAAELGVILCDLPTLLAESDVVTLHVSLDMGSRGLIGAAELRRMKPSALLINTSRGGVVDEAALLDALRDGTIGGAALDVLAVEPPGATLTPFLSLPNVIVTPHCAGTTRESVARAARMAAENVARVLSGRRPLHAVNPEVCTQLGLEAST
jgi:D-3-phosphoglycerate dehydrogenase/(S)-sulfolactate dehydrogenase